MPTPSLDLTKLLPPRYRDKTLDTLVKNLFNRHLSKTDVLPLFGHVGDRLDIQPGDVQLRERDLERQINQLSPLMYAEHGTEKLISSWPDLLQKLVLMGVDYQTLNNWFTSSSYNFVPPIDLDKFCNFNEYFWIGGWVSQVQTLPYDELGIPKSGSTIGVNDFISPIFTDSNPTYSPEYYMIKRGTLAGVVPQPSVPTLTSWSDWSLANLWVHRDDLMGFLSVHGGLVSFSDLVQANRPIIEYSDLVRLNVYQTALGDPADTGVYAPQRKHSQNQPPLFDLYHMDGTHTGLTSAIFYYQEGSQYPVDSSILRRVATDENADFIFEHSLQRADKELYFYNLYDAGEAGFELKTIWRSGPSATISYSKFDTSGTLINQDKFTNFRNYFWTGVDTSPLPVYNSTGLPEYTVIEPGGTSDWSVYNFWVHVSQLRRYDLYKYVQAERPIIEFNKNLESELLEAKMQFEQLPRFQLYLYDDVSDIYNPLPAVSDPNLNDAYLQGKLLARLADLPEVESTVLTTSEILALSFTYNGEQYLQGLYSGKFVPERDGTIYGYLCRYVDFQGTGDGTVTSITTDPSPAVCTPEVLTLTATSPTTFSVVGTVTGAMPALTTEVVYSSPAGANFKVTSGVTPFAVGDTFTLEIKSYVFEPANLYVQLDGVFRTLTSPSSILTEVQSSVVVPANPAQLDGVWQIPPQLEWNVQNETRSTVGQGDLYFHLISIIGAQPNLVGSSTGKNNWRELPSPDVGLGGTIKEYDGNAALLVSMLLQEGITPATLIEFAKKSYEQLFVSIKTFVNDQVPQLLTDVAFIPPTSGDAIDPVLVAKFKEYFSTISTVVTDTATPTDDFVSSPFFDSTSALSNLVVTLPYIGLEVPVVPEKTLDLELNLPVIVHHDGHRSQTPTVSTDVLKSVVTKNFERSPGQKTPGLISGATQPSLPYKGQFWFKTTTGELFYYQVVSDTNERPPGSIIGTYTYDRAANLLYQYDGANWISAALTLPWAIVKLDLIEANLILALETELYQNCPPLTQRLDTGSLESNLNFDIYQEEELKRFGVTYGVADVYGSAYDPGNAFTWNYSAITCPGASGPFAVWQEIYRDVYGTPRPDLEPWFSSGYPDEPTFIAAAILAGALPPLTTTFDSTTMWPLVATFVSGKQVLLGRPAQLSVDATTGVLLPPYSTNINGLTTTVPPSAPTRFSYGDLGPVETFWRKTLNFLYSKQKSFFRIDPLTWVQETWGIKYHSVSEYILNSYLRNKEAPTDFMLHGDQLKDTPQNSWFNVTALSVPPVDSVYTLKFVSRLDGIWRVSGTNLLTPQFFTTGAGFSDAYISITIDPTLRDFFWGETLTVNFSSGGDLSWGLDYLSDLRAEGFNQLYVQYSRVYGDDLAISVNRSLFSDWVSKLGYRFGGFVNTDSLTVESNRVPVVGTAFNVFLKENKYYNSTWLNALRVQLVQRGSTERAQGYDVPKVGPSGTPGEDWIFRVDNFNASQTNLTWYKFDPLGETQDFVALDGRATLYSWKRFKTPSEVLSYHSPFLITGIQNVINFVFGYSDLREVEGWRFNDQENPVLDPSTGRPIGYQLLTEQFIAQQFLGATAGSAFLFNPFSRKVWFSTPRGMVADLFQILGLDQETVPSILDQQARHIERSDVRVFRQDDLTEIVFDKPAFTVHLLVSEFEHVVLFENYSVDNLLYDAFLGQRTGDIFLEGEKQTVFTGRIDFGGHFLLGDQMKRNIESSVQSILGLYDTTSNLATIDEKERARALLGFQKKQYFADRGTPDTTEFRFWQGMIGNKGTNFSITAYLNSQKFKTAKLDEYWAYRLADYGDARIVSKVEMRSQPEDCQTELTNYLFLEEDETDLADDFSISGGYDVHSYDLTPFDSFSPYTSEQALLMEFFDARGCVLIRPEDEARWYRYVDLKALQYFTADVIAEWLFTPTSLEECYTVLDGYGNPVRADCFELHDTSYVEGSEGYDMLPYDTQPFDSEIQGIYYEIGDYIIGTDPPEYSPPKFKRLNTATIQLTHDSMLGRTFKVVAYGPAISKYSPHIIFNYQTNTTVRDDVIWWDPARGSHHPEAHREVDYTQNRDPARYNVGTFTKKNEKLEKQKPWGENEVGKIWWDTLNLEWQLYSDTKVYSDLHERLARWGSPAEFSTVKTREWIKSSLSPKDYEAAEGGDGVLAVKDLLKRERTWFQRTVAWKFSDNPATAERGFITYQPSQLKVTLAVDGTGTAILNEGSFSDLGVEVGHKLAGAVYSSTSKTLSNLTGVFGSATVTAAQAIVVGSSINYDGGPTFIASPSLASLAITINEQVLSFREEVLGAYQLSNQYDTVAQKFFITLTHVSSGRNQRLEVHDTPINAGYLDEYDFDEMGAVITYSTTFNHTSVPLATNRMSAVAIAIGSIGHDIRLRNYVEIFSPIDFGLGSTFILNSSTDVSVYGWVVWSDPPTNPLSGPKPPFHKYEPVLGEWVEVGDFLSNLVDDITLRVSDPWTGFVGEDQNSYKCVWSEWERILDEHRDHKYYTTTSYTHADFFDEYFTFTGMTELEVTQRVDFFINGIKVRADGWTIIFFLDVDGDGRLREVPVGIISEDLLSKGDKVRAVIRFYQPTTEELAFNPETEDNDPLILTQWVHDYPHVYEEKRNSLGGLTVKNYYFWVSDKVAPAKGNALGVKKVADLLRWHDGTYAVPQVFKFFNQIDARPNRYGLLSIKDLSRYVKVEDTYKLRLTRNPILRDDDRNLDLKNVHVEWKLLRAFQPSRLPRVLWDLLTDALTGETAIGQVLPFEPLSSYDERNDTAVRYGFEETQIFVDPGVAKETLKYTVLNTRVDKYENGQLVPDYIGEPIFSTDQTVEEQLDSYLDTSASIRIFMSDLWRFAKPKQLNEIFFAVLEDAAAANPELTDFFKTSFISLSEVRTVNEA